MIDVYLFLRSNRPLVSTSKQSSEFNLRHSDGLSINDLMGGAVEDINKGDLKKKLTTLVTSNV